MRNKIGLSVVIAFIGFSSVAQATTGSGKIGQLLVGRLGKQVYVQLISPTFLGTWPCSGTDGSGYNYALDLTTPGANAILATLLAAQLSNRQVTIQGSGACTVTPLQEDLSYVIIAP